VCNQDREERTIDGWIDCDIKLAKVRNGFIFTGQGYRTFNAEINTLFTIAHISEKLIRSMNFSQFCKCFIYILDEWNTDR
jgi:hypothetical protein